MNGWSLHLLAWIAVVACRPAVAWGQAAWEYSPYEVRIWIAAASQVELPAAVVDEIAVFAAERSESVFGAVWSVKVEPAPAMLRDDLLAGREPEDARLRAASADVLQADKLLIVAIAPGAGGWQTAVRELDIRSRQWGPAALREAVSIQGLPLAAWDAARESFAPLARIETVEGPQVTARLRAGGLIVDADSPAQVQKGGVLRPIIRRNDRAGEPAPKIGIQPVPWTLLSVAQRIDALLTCEMFSGFRAAVPARGGVRTERLALLVRPRYSTTRLTLHSRTVPPHPLTGYDVFARRIGQEESVPVGSTDWRGSIELPAGDGSLGIFLVRNGNQLLARLPIVPGQAAALDAQLSDDDLRLQAEGAVTALYSRAIDLVARREILAARFRARLKEQKFEDAQLLLDEFRKLETRIDLGRSLDEQQQQLRGADKLTQTRVDKLLTDARKILLLKQLADDLVNTLAAELAQAKATAKQTSVP